MPVMPAHAWHIRSMRQHSFSAPPSVCPPAKYARLYHAPSHAFACTAFFSPSACSLYIAARSPSPISAQSGTKRISTSYKNMPSHTLSPPPRPTLSIPSFQSPPPISGSPCAPTARDESIALTQCVNTLSLSSVRSMRRYMSRSASPSSGPATYSARSCHMALSPVMRAYSAAT